MIIRFTSLKTISLKFILFLFFLPNTELFSQFILPSDSNWSQVAARNTNMLPDTSWESPYQLFRRLQGFWEPRLAPNGKFSNVQNALRQYYQSYNNNQQQIPQLNNFGVWSDLGPSSFSSMDIGRTTRIQVDQNDPSGNTVYALSPVGGIFKTTSAMSPIPNWINYKTDFILGATSISDIRLVTTTNNVTYLYAAVSGDESFYNTAFIGIYRYNITNDPGTWEDCTANLTCTNMLGSGQMNTVRKMLIDPQDISKIYLATSKGMFYTCTGCGQVTNCDGHPPAPNFDKWVKSSLNESLLGIDFEYPKNDGLYCSGRQIWHSPSASGSFSCISSNNPNLAAFDNFSLGSLPLGATPINQSNTSITSFINIATSSAHPNKLFATVACEGAPILQQFLQIMKYDKNSVGGPAITFTSLSTFTTTDYYEVLDYDKHFIHLSSSNSNLLYFNKGRAYLSAVGINTYVALPVINLKYIHADCHDFDFTSNGSMIGSNDGGVYYVESGTSSVTPKNGNGLGVTQIYGFDIWEKTSNDIIIGTQDTHNKYSTFPFQNNWVNELTGNFGDGASPLFTNNGNCFLTGNSAKIYWIRPPVNLTYTPGRFCNDQFQRANSRYKSVDGNEKTYTGGLELAFNYDPYCSTTGCTTLGVGGGCPSPVNGSYGWNLLSNVSLNPLANGNPCTGNSVVSDFAVSEDHKTIYVGYMIWGASSCPYSNQQNFPILLKTTTGGSMNPNVNPQDPCNGMSCWNTLGTVNSLSLAGFPNAICINPSNPDQVWIGASGYSNTTSPALYRHMLYSQDGGNTFVDFSQGLPNFPVNEIILRRGTNFELFAATDVGVYYRDNTMNNWICINYSVLPNAIVTDIKIDECDNKLYAGTFGRGLWSLDLPPPVNPLSLTTITLSNINAPIVFNSTKYFFSNVLIKAGTTVQFANANIFMGPNTKITVEPGAILSIDGSTVQSYCDKNMWEGIHCLGTSSVSHQQSYQQSGYYSAHGFVFVSNNSLIKDAARAAVFLDQGGVVKAYNSRFENNRKDLEFHIFTFPNNHSIAQNCVFETNADTKKVSNGIDSHVTAWAVDGVTFRGCTFQNIAPPGSNNNNLGNGIGAEDAFLKIDNYCQSNCTVQPQPNNHTVFKNLAYGIYAQGVTSNLRSFYVRNTDFENCQRGAYIKNMDWAKFQFCDFKIPSDQLQYGPYVLSSPYGLYFDNCQNFFCENNKFTGLPGLQLASAATGVYVNNSNANATRVYNCDFNNLQVGSAGLFDNYYEPFYFAPQENVGLRFNCNKYTECNYDVAVMGGAFNYVPTDIDNVQGFHSGSFPNDVSKSVRNLYSAFCQPNEDNQFYNDKIVAGQYIHYNHATQSGNGSNYFTKPQVGCYNSNNLLPIDFLGDFVRNPSSCPTSGINSGAPCLDCNLAALNVNISNLKSEIVTETAKLTGAASQTLISLINSNISNGDLINVLITQSPLLSDQVLLAYFNKAGIPPGHIKQVHGLNAPVSPAVWQAIDNLNLPPGIENQIIKAQMAATQVNGGLSGRRNFEAKISSLKSQATYLLNEKTRIFLSDSLERNVDSLKVVIQDPIYADRDLKLLDFYISTAQYSLASTQNSQIAMRRGTIYAPYNNVKSMIISALSSTSGLNGLSQDATIEGYLHSLANTDFSPGQKEAQALSDFVFDKKYLEYTLLPEVSSPDGSRPMKEEQKEKSPITDNPKLNAIPNPASGDVVIQYQLPQGANYGILKVVDITGREVYKTDVITSLDKIYLSTKDWANGMYYYSLTVDNQIIGVKTIVVAK